jgi:hypothetical protein
VRPNSLAAVALGALVLAGGVSTADGPGNAPSACYSYREAKARWGGAYLTWRYDGRKRQCWAPRGRSVGLEPTKRVPIIHSRNPPQLRGAEDIAPEFPQPGDLKINLPSVSEILNPAGMGWVWDVREKQQAEIVTEIVAPPVTIYSTFDGEPPDVWPDLKSGISNPQSKTAGSGLPTVLLLALMAGGGLAVAAVGVEGYRRASSWRTSMSHRPSS